jgi:hypothetical protein
MARQLAQTPGVKAFFARYLKSSEVVETGDVESKPGVKLAPSILPLRSCAGTVTCNRFGPGLIAFRAAGLFG